MKIWKIVFAKFRKVMEGKNDDNVSVLFCKKIEINETSDMIRTLG